MRVGAISSIPFRQKVRVHVDQEYPSNKRTKEELEKINEIAKNNNKKVQVKVTQEIFILQATSKITEDLKKAGFQYSIIEEFI